VSQKFLPGQGLPCKNPLIYFDHAVPASRQTVGIKFTHRPKISIFAPQETMHRFTWNLAGLRATWVRLAVQNFTSIGARGGNAAPKIEIFLCLVKSRHAGANTLTDFYSCQGLLYAQLSCISVLHLTWFASQITELFLRNRASVIYHQFFLAPCRKNYALDRKMIKPF